MAFRVHQHAVLERILAPIGSPHDMVVVPPRHRGDLLVANRTDTALLLPEQPQSPSAHQGPGHLHAETFLGAETGTQLESITSCVPVSSHVGKQSIPTTGLSPASPTALWAANQEQSLTPSLPRGRERAAGQLWEGKVDSAI